MIVNGSAVEELLSLKMFARMLPAEGETVTYCSILFVKHKCLGKGSFSDTQISKIAVFVWQSIANVKRKGRGLIIKQRTGHINDVVDPCKHSHKNILNSCNLLREKVNKLDGSSKN